METHRAWNPEMIHVRITCRVNPSEDETKVVKSVLSIFPDAEILTRDGEISGKTNSVSILMEKLRKQRIRSAARAHLLRCITETGEIVFYLNKQAALIGRVNFADKDTILGGMEIRIEAGQPEALINYLTREDEDSS